MTIFDVIEILENGYDCSNSPRKKGVIEKAIKKKDGLIKVVVSESYSIDDNEVIWIVIHVG